MSNWKNERVLVLGAAGFCGAHLCETLANEGAKIIALDTQLPPDSYLVSSGTLAKIHFVSGDILDLPALRLLLERFPVQTVFHLAAQPIVSISNVLPLETAQINILGTYHVLEAIRLCAKPPKLVFASSGAVYGATNAAQAIPETAPQLAASNIYAPTKAAADSAVRCYAQIYGIRAATCRWMNTYGPGDTNFSRVIPATFRRASEGKPGLIAQTDGTNVLELLHVRDMIAAYLCVAQNLERDDISGEAFNFGGGAPLVLKNVVQSSTAAWNRATGDDVPTTPEISGPRVESAKFLDISRAQRLLGWSPRLGLDEGLEETARWYKAHFSANFS
mgnify:FL=1